MPPGPASHQIFINPVTSWQLKFQHLPRHLGTHLGRRGGESLHTVGTSMRRSWAQRPEWAAGEPGSTERIYWPGRDLSLCRLKPYPWGPLRRWHRRGRSSRGGPLASCRNEEVRPWHPRTTSSWTRELGEPGTEERGGHDRPGAQPVLWNKAPSLCNTDVPDVPMRSYCPWPCPKPGLICSLFPGGCSPASCLLSHSRTN